MSERPPNDGDRLGRRPAGPPPVEEPAPAPAPGWPRSAVLSVAVLALIVLLLLVVVLT